MQLIGFPINPGNRVVTKKVRDFLEKMLNWEDTEGDKAQPTMKEVLEWIKNEQNKIYD